MDNFIDIRNVVKQYDGHRALNGVSMTVPQGSVYGLLGPNGAGKTSLIRIINRITRPDSGEVWLDGHQITDHDVAHIGYLPEERGLYKKMKVADHIVYLARLKGMAKADALAETYRWLDRFDLRQWHNKKVEALSKGMQQKVQFIATVIHRPKLLILDEPFSGFDPINADQLKAEILGLRDEGSTILFSTHNMESVESICDHITLINHAEAVLQGRVDQIRQSHKKNIIGIETPADLPANDSLYSILPPPAEQPDAKRVRLAAGVTIREAITWLNENIDLRGFREILPSMHEIFVETVKGKQPEPPQADNNEKS